MIDVHDPLFGGELTPVAGGFPVKAENGIIGGVGAGGSTDTNQDSLCAKEAVKVLTS